MRLLALSGILLIAASGRADQLVSIPTGNKVPFGMVRLDLSSGFSDGYLSGAADFGIGKSFEATLRGLRLADQSGVGTFDVAYNYIAPIAGIIPGLSFGVQDGLGRTPDGRRFFMALSSREIVSTDGGDAKSDVTVGVFVGHLTSPFVGLDMPLSPYLRLLVEHNGYRISAGLELRPVQNLGIRFIAVDGHPTVGVTTLTKF